MIDSNAARRRGPGWVLAGFLGLLVGMVLVASTTWNNPLSGMFGEGETEVDRGPVIVQSVRTLAELSTIEMVESTTIEATQDTGFLNFATGDQLFLFAVATISAGVDLSEVAATDVTIDDEANSIRLRLPPPTITAVEVDVDQTRVYSRETGLFTSGDVDLETEARRHAEDTLVDAALESGILLQARDATEDAMEALLGSLGYDRVSVVFANAPG